MVIYVRNGLETYDVSVADGVATIVVPSWSTVTEHQAGDLVNQARVKLISLVQRKHLPHMPRVEVCWELEGDNNGK
jgi:hypothetical protein